MPNSMLRTSTRRLTALACVALALGAAGCEKPARERKAEIRVAAASDLAFAFEDVGAAFERKTGTKVTFSFGSTGMFAKQLSQGAPFDVFAAANVSFVDDVVKAGACDGATKTPYARGRIVAWVADGGVAPPKDLADLADPRFAKIGIANPEHAPYGRAAQQALTRAGIWETVKPRVVFAENIQQTLQFAQSGNTEVSIVALSLALATKGGSHVVVDDALHDPIDQALVVCNRGGDAKGGQDFADYVSSPEGRAIMKRFGFLLPGETLSKAP